MSKSAAFFDASCQGVNVRFSERANWPMGKSGSPMSIANDVTQTNFTRSTAHQKRAHQIIPGAAHTYAKGDDQFPAGMCPVIVRGEGSHVFDLDGNDFIEYGSGVRSVTLGHGYKPVCDAAYKAMLDGTNFARPSVIELAAAEKMLEVIDKADMVKFGKNGSDAVSGAVKICRAYTGREMIAICGDHPFFSVDDWFMGTTAMNAGIPQFAKQQTVKFKYNDLPNVQALFDKYPNQIACLILEGETLEIPQPNYLHDLQELCHKNGALMILDETVTGFRWNAGGVQKFYNFT
ncbi:MAG TPA: aminotransferase class III-fold pyridoxal phosphate-dependent enzyme, partial [Tepidisphaeraceae bacterium]